MRKVIVKRVRGTRPGAPPRLRQGEAALTSGVVIRQFDPTMLELGDLNAPCQEKEAIAAVFDLTGFTKFCNQVDAHLAIPRFLTEFLDWLFNNIRVRITDREYPGGSGLWAEIPPLSPGVSVIYSLFIFLS